MHARLSEDPCLELFGQHAELAPAADPRQLPPERAPRDAQRVESQLVADLLGCQQARHPSPLSLRALEGFVPSRPLRNDIVACLAAGVSLNDCCNALDVDIDVALLTVARLLGGY